jgi:hypothetical protein
MRSDATEAGKSHKLPVVGSIPTSATSSPLPEVPERPPEEDAFLYTVVYDSWVECYLTERRDC